MLAAAIGIHHVEHLMALVMLHAVVTYLIDYLLSVGRGTITADAPHGPKCLGSHPATLYLDVLFSDVHVFFCVSVAA